MKKTIISLLFWAALIQSHVLAQIYYWERVYDGIINGDTVCNAYSGGFNVSGSRSTVFDLDGDGDLDFFIGNTNTGQIDYIRNDGTVEKPCWNLVSHNFANLNLQLGTPSPFFADINGDSLPDLITGDFFDAGIKGTVHYYVNNSIGSNFQFVLENDTLANIIAFDDSDPVAGDVDNDGDVDLIVGGGTGDVYFCRNKGNNQWATPVKIYQQSGTDDDKASPALGDLNGDSIPELIVGSAFANIKLFKIDYIGQDTILWKQENSNYITSDNFGFTAACGYGYTTPIFADFNADSLTDLLLVNNANEVVFHKNIGTSDSAVWSQGKKYFPDFNFLYSVNASIEDLNNDGKEELITPHSCNDFFTIYTNESLVANPDWELFNTLYADSLLTLPTNFPNNVFDINDYTFVDYDGDSLKDIVIRKITSPTLAYYKNVSTLGVFHFEYTMDSSLENIFNVGTEGFISTGDLDDNNKIDFIMYNDDTQMKEHYEYASTPQAHLDLKSSNFQPNIFGVPTIVDYDFDHRVDIVTNNSGFKFYKNIGTTAAPSYQLQTIITNNGLSDIDKGWKIKFANLDGKCGRDIYTSTANGILTWGFRGIKPKINQPLSTTFEICDSSTVSLIANPLNGAWEGLIDSNGAFTPSNFPAIGDYWILYSYTDPGGCFTKQDSLLISIIDCNTSTTESSNKNILSIFPNPGSDNFIIKYFADIAEPINIGLYDVAGKNRLTLFEGISMGEKSINWVRPTWISDGMYIITISTSTQCVSKKVILR